MKSLIIAGGSGFLGTVLMNYFESKVANIYVLSRTKKPARKNVTYLKWDAKNIGNWAQVFEGADVLINLTGKSVDCRYNDTNKKCILSSRVNATKLLGEVIEACKHPPKIWLNSSTATIYRHSLDKEMDEIKGEIGSGFSVNVAKAWEKQFFSFKLSNTRQVALRTSIVLGNQGGAFVPIKRLTKIGLGGKQGPGNQKVSWIHALDFARSIEFIIENDRIQGVINVVAPKPTTNTMLMLKLRKKLKVPFGIPMSKALLTFGAKIINTETELILKSRNVIPKKLQVEGFTFQFPKLDNALDNLLT
ncbi:TIGR01777 family protein [Rasiella rasia]|uniref:TIGR01777 family protein n=1 Tax=Rasiella rasia TaxID=2744027 RepID=A0A6G6GP40_9FLAO|nr:TIGR01777 family oxidoreductase [Rasiella rasia]QIE60346.1 TIGR01777 family protein [Rasiella rasia]